MTQMSLMSDLCGLGSFGSIRRLLPRLDREVPSAEVLGESIGNRRVAA